MWLAGVPDGARVIVQGQDFVREGNLVEPVARGRAGRAALTEHSEPSCRDSSTTPSAMPG